MTALRPCAITAAMPRGPGRPLVAVLARNEGTETTDFLLTHAILQRSGVADVVAVAPRRGVVRLYPVFQVSVEEDLAGFDDAHPSGADYVIVPALDDDGDSTIAAWLREQRTKGASIISVCAGALELGRAGLLDSRRFTTHWYYRKTVLDRHPTAVYVPDRRSVVDRDVATTAGITASMPAMIALVEAIAGPAKAKALAAEIGVVSWTPLHDSSRFGLNARLMSQYVFDTAAFWRDERWIVDVRDGMSDIALALAADAWTRTGRVNIDASAAGPVRLMSGLMLEAQPSSPQAPRMPLSSSVKPVEQLDRTLCEIEQRFGVARRERVMMELEYAGPAACPP